MTSTTSIPSAIVAVALGSAAGGVLRWSLSSGIHALVGSPHPTAAFPGGFPWGTLTVNVIGCAAIGMLVGAAAGGRRLGELGELALLVGFLGGFTTFSAFGRETIELVRHDRAIAALAYVAVSNVAGLAAVAVGWGIGAGFGVGVRD